MATTLPHFALHLLTIFTLTCTSRAAVPPPPTELRRGFTATPKASVSDFQPLLADPSGNFHLGFLRLDGGRLSLSVIHVPSSVPLWSAGTTRVPRWGKPTELFFNGSLVLSDPKTGVFWSSHTDGDRVWLSDTSNLEIGSSDNLTLWQSFDFPSDTLVVNQNFTNTTELTSSSGPYSMRLGQDFFGLYAKFGNSDQMYLRHGAMQAKAQIIFGQPVQLILESGGYLGMFQNSSIPADVQPFDTFQQNLTGFRRLRLEPDGNLKAYYWTGSTWILDYKFISDPCELPSACGAYALCRSGNACSCLDNRTEFNPGSCAPPQTQISGDFCGQYVNRFKTVKQTGVELPYKELMGYKKMSSYEECERTCEGDCMCWGVVYSNSSGFCYTLASPVQTLLAITDQGKMGYFKVREGAGKKKLGTWLGLGLGILVGAILIFGVILGVGWYKWRKRGVKGYGEEGDVANIGPYKDLGAASFRSIELCER